MNAIVAVNEDWGIGAGDELLVHLPPDLKRFRSLTLGGTVIVGRKTLKTFPKGAPLKGRENLILSRQPGLSVPGGIVCANGGAALAAVGDRDPETVFVIGGESVYRAFLPLCRKIYVTKFRAPVAADRFFPNLDERTDWAVASAEPWQEFEGIPFQYVTYRRVD